MSYDPIARKHGEQGECRMRVSMIVIVAVVFLASVVDAQIAIRPGQYEYLLDMKMTVPKEAAKAVLDAAGFKDQKRLECITAEQAQQAKADVAKFFAQEMQLQNCTMSDVKIAGNRVSFNSTCIEDAMKMVISTDMTFGVDSFSSISTTKLDGGVLSTTTMTAKRVGECK
jgi:ribosomal protein S13